MYTSVRANGCPHCKFKDGCPFRYHYEQALDKIDILAKENPKNFMNFSVLVICKRYYELLEGENHE